MDNYKLPALRQAPNVSGQAVTDSQLRQSKYDRLKSRNFISFPILATERLTLRQLLPDDQNDILALRSDTEINQYLDRQPSKTIEDAINFINKVNDNIKLNNSIYWVITLTTTKTFVGTICLFDFSDEKNSCEIGYELMTKFQGQGIMWKKQFSIFRKMKIVLLLVLCKQ